MARVTQNEFNTIRAAVDAFKHFMEDRTGRPSDDLSFPNKLIYYYLRMYKNKVAVADLYNKHMLGIDKSVVNFIPCVEVEEVDFHDECPCAPPSGCTWFRSKYELPDMLNGTPTVVSTLKPNPKLLGNGVFTYVSWENIQHKLNGRLKGDQKQLLYTTKNINNLYRLYLLKPDDISNIKGVTVGLVPKDPLQVAEFPVCGQERGYICNPLDEEFILEEEIRSNVFEMTFNALINMRNMQPNADVLNNENDDTEATVRT